MQCPKCKSTVNKPGKYCPYCGKRLVSWFDLSSLKKIPKWLIFTVIAITLYHFWGGHSATTTVAPVSGIPPQYLDTVAPSSKSEGTLFAINNWSEKGVDTPFINTKGIVITRGIGMQSDPNPEHHIQVGQVEYQLNGVHRFEAEIALDRNNTKFNGSNISFGTTVCAVYIDDKQVQTWIVTDDSAPEKISVPIAPGARTLRLEIQQVPNAKGDKHKVIWGEARLYK